MNYFKKEFTGLKQNGENSKMKWLRSRDVRKMLGVQDSTLQQMRIRGDFPAYKLGGIWYYLEHEINEAILNGKICNN
jgi:predicted DNA-binding transcriptional regulator AlpA